MVQLCLVESSLCFEYVFSVVLDKFLGLSVRYACRYQGSSLLAKRY